MKLSKTTEIWNREYEFFKSTLYVNKEIRKIDKNICHLQELSWEYFKIECRNVSENDIYSEIFPATTIYQRGNWEKLYVKLKVKAAILIIMKFVMFQSWYKEKDIQQSKNDEKIKSNFGAIAKKRPKKNDEVQPNFDKKKPVKSILKLFWNSAIPKKNIPTRMKKLETAHTVFDLELPSYKEITKIINRKGHSRTAK